MTATYKPTRKLQVEISEKTYQRLKEILPHGSKQLLFNALIRDLIKQHERRGDALIGAIVNGRVGIGWVNNG
jgi:hypothetical protein